LHEKKKIKQDRIALVGIGNMYMKDDGLGVKLLHTIKENYIFPSHVTLIDAGTTIYHNMHILIESDKVIILDAVKLNTEPGTIHNINPEEYSIKMPRKVTSHDIGLLEAFFTLKLINKDPPECIIIGVEPKNYSSWGDSLSLEVEKQIPQLIDLTFRQLALWDVHPLKKYCGAFLTLSVIN
jgi:hydrogenase maturation protease